MNRILSLLCLLSLALYHPFTVQAVDFKMKGQWQFAFSAGDNNLVDTVGDRKADSEDAFHARQRLRLQMDAVASPALSGTVFFEIGQLMWGNDSSGAALGADQTVVKLRQAYTDWTVPGMPLRVRMGIQNINLPKKAGGGMVMDNMDAAAVTASWCFNDAVSLTGLWVRPFNDNATAASGDGTSSYLDNMDLFALILPVRQDGWDMSPWVMFGLRGKNTFPSTADGSAVKIWKDGMPHYTLSSDPFGGAHLVGETDKAWGSMFWAGLPVGISAFAPWNFELDINYGYVEAMGRYDMPVRGGQRMDRASTRREGWLAMALAEYRLDWGTPGIFGWYASGDDGSLKNGSERMPSIDPWSKFTSFMGAANPYPTGYNDLGSNYAGTWGIGVRLKDMSFLPDLKHTLRVACWNGTNSTGMVKYAQSRDAWNYGFDNNPNKAGMYLTTADHLLEFNLDSYWKVYENLTAGLELGYIVNGFDKDTWQKDGRDWLGPSMSRQDAWHATLYFGYSF